MIRAKKIDNRQLGWTAEELQRYAYGKYWQPVMKGLSAEAREALLQGAIAEPLLPTLTEANTHLFNNTPVIENGFTLNADGSMCVAIRTDMPGTVPAMVDWWFGWHGISPERYKLWHPHAHVHAQWQGKVNKRLKGRELYRGNTSIVDEYVGSDLGRYAIRFVWPEELGLTDASLNDDQQGTAVCARVGLADYPLDVGYLVHHVRRTAKGSEMRSRFWLGGPYAGARHNNVLAQAAVHGARKLLKPNAEDARSLLVHCAQEMAHLASFLPALYEEFGEMEDSD